MPVERVKILDLAVYASSPAEQLQLFVCFQVTDNTTNKTTVQIYEFKFAPIRRDNFKDAHPTQTRIAEHERSDATTGENTRKAKIALGFDKNPFLHQDAKVAKVYSCSKSGIYINELDGSGGGANSVKLGEPIKNTRQRPNRKANVPTTTLKSDIVSIAVSPHDKTRIAIASEEQYMLRHYESQEHFQEDIAWHSFGTNLETLCWHPTQSDWFGAVKNKTNDTMSSVSIFDFGRRKNIENIELKKTVEERKILWQNPGNEQTLGQWSTLKYCKQLMWRPGGRSNRFQILSLQTSLPGHQEYSLCLWDIRRPHHPIAILKPDLSQHDVKTRRGSSTVPSGGGLDPADDQEASDWSASFTVTNNGASVFTITKKAV